MERVATEIQSIASARGLGVFSLQQLWADVKTPQTTNGLQLAATGYRNVAPAFAKAVGMANAPEAEILMLQEGIQDLASTRTIKNRQSQRAEAGNLRIASQWQSNRIHGP